MNTDTAEREAFEKWYFALYNEELRGTQYYNDCLEVWQAALSRVREQITAAAEALHFQYNCGLFYDCHGQENETARELNETVLSQLEPVQKVGG